MKGSWILAGIVLLAGTTADAQCPHPSSWPDSFRVGDVTVRVGRKGGLMGVNREILISGATGEAVVADYKTSTRVVAAQLTPDQFFELIHTFYAVNFLDLRDCYPSVLYNLQWNPTTGHVLHIASGVMEDAGCTSFTITIGAFSKTVYDYGSGPRELKDLSRWVWAYGTPQ